VDEQRGRNSSGDSIGSTAYEILCGNIPTALHWRSGAIGWRGIRGAFLPAATDRNATHLGIAREVRFSAISLGAGEALLATLRVGFWVQDCGRRNRPRRQNCASALDIICHSTPNNSKTRSGPGQLPRGVGGLPGCLPVLLPGPLCHGPGFDPIVRLPAASAIPPRRRRRRRRSVLHSAGLPFPGAVKPAPATPTNMHSCVSGGNLGNRWIQLSLVAAAAAPKTQLSGPCT